jgi:hypothetical protein
VARHPHLRRPRRRVARTGFVPFPETATSLGPRRRREERDLRPAPPTRSATTPTSPSLPRSTPCPSPPPRHAARPPPTCR